MHVRFRVLALAGLVGAVATLGVSRVDVAQAQQAAQSQPPASVALRTLAPGIFVAGRISPGDLAALKDAGVKAIVDLLPDEEAAPQAASAQIETLALQAGMAFAYAPTPQGPVAAGTVDKLAEALAKGDRPVLLYCRSGARATRVWALSEASRRGGPGAEIIVRAAAAAGFPVEDVRPEIERRIAARGA